MPIRALPLPLAGSPNAVGDPARECFPPALRFEGREGGAPAPVARSPRCRCTACPAEALSRSARRSRRVLEAKFQQLIIGQRGPCEFLARHYGLSCAGPDPRIHREKDSLSQ